MLLCVVTIDMILHTYVVMTLPTCVVYCYVGCVTETYVFDILTNINARCDCTSSSCVEQD